MMAHLSREEAQKRRPSYDLDSQVAAWQLQVKVGIKARVGDLEFQVKSLESRAAI